jgi:hypothetical protein
VTMPDVLTYSRIKMRKNCPASEHYRYEQCLTPITRKQSLSIGSAVHKGLETGSIEEALKLFDDILPNSQDEMDELEINKVIVSAMLAGYFAKFKPFLEYKAEIQFDIPILNPLTKHISHSFRLQGKIDKLAKIDGLWWLVEYKTASQINQGYFERLELDEQITTYIYAAQKEWNIKIAGVIYRVLKKPSIRQTKKETLEQFCKRLEKDYIDRPEFYFYEQQLYRSQEDLERFEQELWDFTQQYLYEKRNGINYRNCSRCLDWGRCQYMPICCNEPDWNLKYEVKEINEELNDNAVANAKS